MSLPLLLLVSLLVAAVGTAVFVFATAQQRRQLLGRADGRQGGAAPPPSVLLARRDSLASRLGAWLAERLPASWADDDAASGLLVQAGFGSATAPVVYSTIRLAFGLLLPAVVFAFSAIGDSRHMLLAIGLAVAIALIGPPAVLDRLVRRRRTRITNAIPDALDLLVVCVEAGVSLDAAIVRVARDMATTHPDLSGELLIVNRRVNAGIPREQALHGLWMRTGLDELRGLASSMVQCERWGTSISKVLRIYAQTLRRKRKQSAEKRAAEASVKMLFPLIFFLLPALFVVIVGPAAMRISGMLGVIP